MQLFDDIQPLLQSSALIDEILSCLELFNANKENVLRSKIRDETYYRNFVGIAKNIAPDGKKINIVGFTSLRNGDERKVQLTLPRGQVKFSIEDQYDEELSSYNKEKNRVSVTGRLEYADATKTEKQKIKLIDKKGILHHIIVPKGMMNDIVKPLWDEPVVVEGFAFKRDIYLKDIKKEQAE
jgi:hypothetical protein